MESVLGIDIGQYLNMHWGAILLRVAVLILILLPGVYVMSRFICKTAGERFTVHRAVMLSRLVYYLGIALITVSVLHELGFSLTPLLGTAGIIGVALGFASQTSVSNVISGLFLITEEPFVIGDVLSVGGTTGEVLSIDLLAIKLRTSDNRFVRIPKVPSLRNLALTAPYMHNGVFKTMKEVDSVLQHPRNRQLAGSRGSGDGQSKGIGKSRLIICRSRRYRRVSQYSYRQTDQGKSGPMLVAPSAQVGLQLRSAPLQLVSHHLEGGNCGPEDCLGMTV